MATYYIPPRQHSQSDASYRSSSLSTTAESPIEQPTELELQLDQSVYIFPTPSSVPASPSGSSVFSAPSDFTEAFSSSTDARSREPSFSLAAAERSRSPVRTQNAAPGVTLATGYRTRSRARSSATDDGDPEVEIWDWTAESGEDMPDDEGLWEFEAEVERVSRWDVPAHLARRRSPLRPTADFYEQHYRIVHRARTQSNTTSLTSLSARSRSLSAVHTPHPRIHIPLLSFFAKLLALNLDEPGLRLLTHSASESILFPGQFSLLGEGASTGAEEGEDVDRGLLRLHRDDDGARAPSRVLKDGLAIACDATIPNPFALPGFSTLAGLYRFVGGVWSSGGKAWREVQGSALPVP